MEPGKKVANDVAERRERIEHRKSVVEKVKENLIKHGALNKLSSLYELAELAQKLEEKVNASAKTEAEYDSLMAAEVAKAKKLFTNTSATGTDANNDWQENVYKRLQFLKNKYYPLIHAIHQNICKGLQADPSTQILNPKELEKLRYHRTSIEDLFSLFKLSKSQITADMKDRASKADNYIEFLLMIFMQPDKQQSPDVQSNLISETEAFGTQSPEIQRLLKVMTSISPEALSEALGDIEKVVRLNDEIPTFISPEGWKMYRSFVATTFDTPGVCASIGEGFNQFTDVAAPELDSFTMKGKCPPAVANQNILAEIKDINNRLFESEVVIAEKKIVESVVGVAYEQREGLLVKIMYNAVTINQNVVSHFTSDKKSLIEPLRLFIPASYPSSSLVILDELPLKVSDDLRALFERAKAKLRLKLQSTKQPWLIKDVASAWEHCAREAVLDYAHANGGGTFTSMYGGWEACR